MRYLKKVEKTLYYLVKKETNFFSIETKGRNSKPSLYELLIYRYSETSLLASSLTIISFLFLNGPFELPYNTPYSMSAYLSFLIKEVFYKKKKIIVAKVDVSITIRLITYLALEFIS